MVYKKEFILIESSFKCNLVRTIIQTVGILEVLRSTSEPIWEDSILGNATEATNYVVVHAGKHVNLISNIVECSRLCACECVCVYWCM